MPIKKKSIVAAMAAPSGNTPKPIITRETPAGVKHESMKKGISIFKS
jgi:hypothetical protein